jgi:glycosyltransferase involved in cell wall biosynthesis
LNTKSQPKTRVTIITVVLNSELLIERTLRSVANQTYQNTEYIVIDGASTDKTVDIIKRYSSKISLFITEPDHGVYDAMNKAIEYATGDWLIFLNAGDLFNSTETVSNISPYLEENKETAIVYGDVLIDFSFFTNHVRSRPIDDIKNVMITNHQACFINSTVHKLTKYDLKYKIASDYDFILKLYNSGYTISQVNLTVSRVQPGGISDTKRDKTFFEYLIIKNKYNKSIMNYIHYYKSLFRFRISHLVKLLLPTRFIKHIYSSKFNN